MLALLAAVVLYSGSLVWMKRIGDDSPPLATTVGALAVALPLFALVWWWSADARVPAAQLVGEIYKGWGMAKTLLGDERIVNGSPRHASYALRRLHVMAEHSGAMRDPAFLDRYAERLRMGSRSAAVQRAVDLLRAEELGPAYADAWETWAADEAGVWDTTVGDGLGPR